MTTIELLPMRVWVDATDRDGRLASSGGRLIAVLVHLNDTDGKAGSWFLEAGFGPANTPRAQMFASLSDAEEWLQAAVARVNS